MTVEAPALPLAELRAWLTAAEIMVDRQMAADDPRRPAALAMAEQRHAEYMARVLAGEPE